MEWYWMGTTVCVSIRHYPVLRRHAATKRTGWFNFIFESSRLVIGQSTRPLGAETTTFVYFNELRAAKEPRSRLACCPFRANKQNFIFESPRLDIGQSTHLPHIPLQPKHSQSTARAQLEHSQSAARAQPEHSQSTAREHSQSAARAQPEYSQSTARVQPEHSQSTVGDSRG